MFNKYVLAVILLGAFLLAPLASASGWGHNKASPCERTADTMLQACRYDVRDNYYETLANCKNLGSRGDRRACYRDAYATKHEESEFCVDVKEARAEACEVLNEERYDVDPLLAYQFVDPDDVGDSIPANPYVSIVAGHTYVLRAGEEQEELVVVHVAEDTREILNQPCRVVIDIVFEESVDEDTQEVEYEVVEVTDDWFAQTTDGDVVYCGEVARNFEDGVLRDLDGSFEAGIDFAKSGFLVHATPRWGEAHRQEFSLGEAEDIVQYVGISREPETGNNENNPDFSCDTSAGCLQTFDFAPIDPESTEFKYYVEGLGFVLAVAMEDGEFTGEREELLCVGDSLDVLSEMDCGIENAELLLEELCALSPDAFCSDDD